MLRIIRSMAPIAASACLIVACSPATGEGQSADGKARDLGYLSKVTFSETNGSVIIGNPDAEVELVEYASLTCSHCADFHNNVMPRIKEDYVATGKVRFVFQEFPTEPVQIALAGFSLARCAGESGYLGVLDDFFGRQGEIFEAGRAGTIGEALIELGERNGIKEADFEGCIVEQSYRRAVSDSVNYGQSQQVNSTPTIILNGVKLETNESRTPEGLAGLIDSALAGDTSSTPVPSLEETSPLPEADAHENDETEH